MIAPAPRDPSTQLVLMSIGNTRTSASTWSATTRSDAEHVVTDPIKPVADLLGRQWEKLPADGNRAVIISSVSPPALTQLCTMAAARNIAPLWIIGAELPPPIEADVREPDKVGTDRLCVAAAAYAKLQAACVVADFGTALTIDLVADDGVFLGGTILPGMALCARALHEHTAQLPRVEVGTPRETLGKDTESAIRNGVFAMMVGGLREIAERYATQIGKWAPLVVTGGDARAVADACDFVDHIVPDLCLDGLLIAYQKHVQDHPDA